jgi:hypothetical protein
MSPKICIFHTKKNEIMKSISRAIEQVIQQDVGNRGIKHFASLANDNLFKTCQHLFGVNTRHVAICTGFTIPPPENDGPLGTLWIAHACLQLGKHVTVVTDELNYSMMDNLLNKYKSQFNVVPSSLLSLKHFPQREQQSEQEALEFAHNIIQCDPPVDHIISIERVGPSVDGSCYNMRGIDISELNGRVEAMFYAAQQKNIFTTGIGDGGNEIGMGNVLEQVKQYIPNGDKIGCTVGCDSLIIAGVSNWAGYGICTMLQVMSGKKSSDWWLDANTDREWLRYMTEDLKIIDGVKKIPSMSVDGLDYEEVHAALIQTILRLSDSA